MSKHIKLPPEIEEMLGAKKPLGLRVREWLVNRILRGVHVRELQFG